MNTDTDENNLTSSPLLDNTAADNAAGAEPGVGGEAGTPPEQLLGGEDIPDDLDASSSDEEGTRSELEHPPVPGEMNTQLDALATDELDDSVKPPFLVVMHDPHRTATRACALISERMGIFQRGETIVALWEDERHGRVVAKMLTPDDITGLVHASVQPYAIRTTRSGSYREDVPFPERAARMCLSSSVVATLPPLDGIAYAPRMKADGSIHDSAGYDAGAGIFFHGLPELNVPACPTRQEGEAAFRRLRSRLQTFPFADSVRVRKDGFAEPVVDLDQPPVADETTMIVALVTVACRPSLDLVPGLLITAPPLSGAGTGKGKLARFLSEVACGISPIAMTAGHSREELDKRLVAVLLSADPFILIDNVNEQELASDQLASAITENPTQVRPMRTSAVVQLNPTTFFCLTGNGLRVTEDLSRRFLTVKLNAGVESPEARSFAGNFLAEAKRDRGAILSDIFTIVRWGVQQGDNLPRGRPLGSFEAWGTMCRDAVMAFSGRDPVVDIANRQATDSRRSELAELVDVWLHHHGDRPVKANDLHENVRHILAPYGESRQRLADRLQRMDGIVYGAYRFKLIPKLQGVDSDRNRFVCECTDPALLDQSHRRGSGSSGQTETGDGFDGLGGLTRPPPMRRT
jgi:hypothetical protein